MTITPDQITGLIISGGQGMRMGKVNKGLQIFKGKPMVEHVLLRLTPQVGEIIINTNQDAETYAQFGQAVIPDLVTGYAGPLAGIHSGLQHCTTPYMVTAPCDSPFLPLDLVSQLAHHLEISQAHIAVVITEEENNGEMKAQLQPVFCMLNKNLATHLHDFLTQGGRKVSDWYATLKVVEVLFTDSSNFRNINTMTQLRDYSSD